MSIEKIMYFSSNLPLIMKGGGSGEMYKAAASMPEKIRRLFKLAGSELPEQ